MASKERVYSDAEVTARLEKELPAGERWSAYDKALGGGAYFPAGAADERKAA